MDRLCVVGVVLDLPTPHVIFFGDRVCPSADGVGATTPYH